MLLVKTYVGPSPIEGVGVFAAEDIKKGQLIYRFDPLFDKLVPRSLIETGPEHLSAFVRRYGYPYNLDPTMFVIDLDHGRYMNHDPLPNTDFTGVTDGYAIRDIKAGEEITCNYNEFEPDHEMEPSYVSAFPAGPAAQAVIHANGAGHANGHGGGPANGSGRTNGAGRRNGARAA